MIDPIDHITEADVAPMAAIFAALKHELGSENAVLAIRALVREFGGERISISTVIERNAKRRIALKMLMDHDERTVMRALNMSLYQVISVKKTGEMLCQKF